MKQLFRSLFLAALAVSVGILISCTEDEEPVADPPVVDFESTVLDGNGTATLEPGEVLSFVISVDAPGGFNTLNGTYFVDGVEVKDTVISRDPGTSPLEYTSDQFRFEIENDDVGSTLAYVFQAVDDDSQLSNELTLTVDVVSPVARSYSTILLAAPLGDKSGQNFFSVATGTKYSPSEVTGTTAAISPTIDFGYYYGVNNMASIASPAGFESTTFLAQVDGWNTKNTTVIKATTLGSTEFNEVTTWADIDEVFDAGTDEEGIIIQLAAGDVIAFETVNGVRGLILVNAIIDGNNDQDFDDNTDSISLDILAQLEAVAP